MDAKRQLLLRRYLSTGDPLDAAAYANEMARFGGAGGGDIYVWIVQLTSYESEDEIHLFNTFTKAQKFAVECAVRGVSNIYQITHSLAMSLEGLPAWISIFYTAAKNGEYKKALDLYKNQNFDDSIELYQKEII